MSKQRYFQLIAPIFPSGVAYLENILLELQIRLYFRGHEREFWIESSASETKNKYILNPHEIAVRQWFPIFEKTKYFDFKEDLSIYVTHEWPSEETTLSPSMIMFVRDGRDAIYSEYKRHNPPIQFQDYLRRPYEVGYEWHKRFNPRLPPAEAWALYCLLWRELILEQGGLIIGFETLKTDPIVAMNQILDFLRIKRDTQSIINAVEESSFKKARAAEQRYLSETKKTRPVVVNRGGKLGEWRKVYEADDMELFNGLPAFALHVLGYEWSLSEHELEASSSEHMPFLQQLEGFITRKELLDIDSVQNILTKELDRVDTNIPQLISLGKALACCMWIRDLFGDDAVHRPEASKALRIFLLLSQHMSNRPLILIAAAKGLIRAQNLKAGRNLLQYATSGKNIHFYDFFEAGLCCLTSLKDKRFAMDLFSKALTCKIAEEALEKEADILVCLGHPFLARHFLEARRRHLWWKTIQRRAKETNTSFLWWLLRAFLPHKLIQRAFDVLISDGPIALYMKFKNRKKMIVRDII